MAITLRRVKGSILTSDEVDDNFQELDQRTNQAQETANSATQLAASKVTSVPGMGLSSNDYTTADKNKLGALPTAQQLEDELNGLAPLASPAFTGAPRAPTPATTDADTKIATAAFVRAAMALFGLGAKAASLVGEDLNDDRPTGFYYCNSPLNQPSAVGNGWLDHTELGAGQYFKQTYTVFTADGRLRVFSRIRVGASQYGPWQELWHTGNLVKQTGPLDTTPGALMAVGAFGLGSTSLTDLGDLDNISASGLYRFGINSPNAPSSINYGTVLSVVRSANEQTQFAISTNTFRAAFRNKVAGVWAARWANLFHTENILGAVSHSSGIPTGAIIERGSNANGEYVRFADGTQICTALRSDVDVPISVAFFGGFRSSGFGWTYPSPFVQLNDAQGTPRSSAHAFSLNVGGSTEAATYLYTAISSQPSASRECYLFAIGRWY